MRCPFCYESAARIDLGDHTVTVTDRDGAVHSHSREPDPEDLAGQPAAQLRWGVTATRFCRTMNDDGWMHGLQRVVHVEKAGFIVRRAVSS